LGKEEGFARLQLHTPEVGLDAKLKKGWLDLIMIADRHSATDEDDVLSLNELLQQLNGGGQIVMAMSSFGFSDA
jgi:hypothetical protein